MARSRLASIVGIPALAVFATAVGQEGEQTALSKPLALTADEMQYAALPYAPPGVVSVVPVGDMARPGIYVLRNKFPPSARVPPHKHGEWRLMTVLEGTVRFAYGDSLDEAKLKVFGPGSLILEPINEYHYFIVGEEGAVLQFVAEGPLTTEFSPTVPLPPAPVPPAR
jgi:quercetin dioxygenase-like cupin family protein